MSTADYQSWFCSKTNGEYRRARPHAEVLRQLLTNTIDATAAANQLMLLDYTHWDIPWALWNLIFEAAAEFSQSHTALLALLTEIKAIESQQPHCEKNQPGTYSKWTGCFGSTWRDKWDMFEPDACFGWTLSASQTIHLWVNINAFSAMILTTPSFTQGAQLRAFGLKMFKQPLEMDICHYEVRSKKKSVVQRPSPPLYRISAQEFLMADVCAAAQWVIHARGLMWDDARTSNDERIQRFLPGKTDLWDGESGLTEDRWQIWKERFLFMADHDDLSLDTQQVARKASQIMEDIH